VAPCGGFLPGQHGFLPKSRAFAPMWFPRRSWVQVTAVQMTRYKVAHSYSDKDEGILSLPAGEPCTLLAAEANGWSLLRTDSGLEGWFPSSYITPVRKYVEIEAQPVRVVAAYEQLLVKDRKEKPEKRSAKKGLVDGKAGKSPKSGGAVVGGMVKTPQKALDMNGAATPGHDGVPDSSKRCRKKTDMYSPTWNGDDEQTEPATSAPPAPGPPCEERASPRSRRRVGTKEDDAVLARSTCGVCFNPNKKLGNSKTISLICNRCDGMIKQGWPYHQSRNPPRTEPGHPVVITNLCIHCWQARRPPHPPWGGAARVGRPT
jgi:hypothetical protein